MIISDSVKRSTLANFLKKATESNLNALFLLKSLVKATFLTETKLTLEVRPDSNVSCQTFCKMKLQIVRHLDHVYKENLKSRK